MGDCKPIGTPLDVKTSLRKLLDEEHEDHLHKMKEIMYQETLGLLINLLYKCI